MPFPTGSHFAKAKKILNLLAGRGNKSEDILSAAWPRTQPVVNVIKLFCP
jgi:hypothetical protein